LLDLEVLCCLKTISQSNSWTDHFKCHFGSKIDFFGLESVRCILVVLRLHVEGYLLKLVWVGYLESEFIFPNFLSYWYQAGRFCLVTIVFESSDGLRAIILIWIKIEGERDVRHGCAKVKGLISLEVSETC
jgi:hypothetical protein